MKLFLLDRNVIIRIKDSRQDDSEKQKDLKKLKALDLKEHSFSPLTSILEGSNTRSESTDEVKNGIMSETAILSNFFKHANTDTSFLKSNIGKISTGFPQIRSKLYFQESLLLIENLRPKLSSPKKKSQRLILVEEVLVQSQKLKIPLCHPVIIILIAAIYKNEIVLKLLKLGSTKTKAYNPVSDIFHLVLIEYIQNLFQSNSLPIEVELLTFDKPLNWLHQHFRKAFSISENFIFTYDKQKINKDFFTEINDNDYLSLLDKLPS